MQDLYGWKTHNSLHHYVGHCMSYSCTNSSVCAGLHFLLVGLRTVYTVQISCFLRRGWREGRLYRKGRYSLPCTLLIHRNHVLTGVYRVNIFQSYQELTHTRTSYSHIFARTLLHPSNSLYLSAKRVRHGRRRAAHRAIDAILARLA